MELVQGRIIIRLDQAHREVELFLNELRFRPTPMGLRQDIIRFSQALQQGFDKTRRHSKPFSQLAI
jgi:hypothetical protein